MMATSDPQFWSWLFTDIIKDGTSDPNYYASGEAQSGEYGNAIQVAYDATQPDTPERQTLVDRLATEGIIDAPDRGYWYGGTQETIGADYANLATAAETFFASDQAPSTVGGQQVPGIPGPQRAGTVAVGGTQIPEGMRLIRITDPIGSDAGEMFMLVGDVYGMNLAYEVGDRAALDTMFGGIGSFASMDSMTQSQFDASDMFTVGTVDEIAGATGSLQAQYERDMRAAGLENPPAWLTADRKAMAIFVTSINERWSTERMYGSLSQTDAFKGRFSGLDTVMSQLGTTSFKSGIEEYKGRESEIRNSLLSARGPNADTSQQYVSSLIASGWQPGEVDQLLGLERRVKAAPDALNNINEILAYQGLPTLQADDFVSFLQDADALTIDAAYTPSELFEGVNDALRLQALLTEGLDISAEFATDLGTGTSDTIGTVEQYSAQAQLAAGYVMRNARELDFDKMGLNRDDIIATSFGEPSPSGKTVAEVNSILETFAKERAKAAQGFAGSQSYIDASGRLRVQGFSDFK